MTKTTTTKAETETETEHVKHAEQDESAGKSTVETCPECDGQLANDPEHGEQVCTECGLVVDDTTIDRGPEWRAQTHDEHETRSRVGAPTSKMYHDDGVSSKISWQNKDAKGNTLSSRQRKKVERLRTWHTRSETRDSHERNLKQALGEIDRMASALGLPKATRETASVIYRRALKEDLLPGRSIEGVGTAAVYVAARQANTPRSLDELIEVSRIGRKELTKTYRYMSRELSLEIAPADPRNYLPQFASDLDVADETEQQARELLNLGISDGITSGKSPVGLTAAALYAGARLCDERLTQREVSEVTGVCEVTIRSRYQELLALHEETSVP